MFGLPQELDGLRGAGDAGGEHLPTGKHLVENLPVRGVVVHHQHAHAVQSPWLGIGLRAGLAVRPTETHGEMEAAAAAGLAVEPDPPAHHADQAGGDGQTQPGSAMPPGGRAVGLLEHAEDGRVFFRGNADPRIGNGEVQCYVVCRAARGKTGFQSVTFGRAGFQPVGALVFRGCLPGDFQHDLAALRKLDGVVDEVDHDLPQSMVVAHDPSGHVLMDMADQLQPLLVGGDGERFHGVAQAFPQMELLMGQHELFGLDLGEIEDIVDHAEQGFAGIADGR